MINWNFREKIIYHEEEITQDSRKFEILVEAYLKDQYPLENWKLTKATRDGNKDLESVCDLVEPLCGQKLNIQYIPTKIYHLENMILH